MNDIFVHPSSLCDATTVGRGTRLWAFSHIMDGAAVGEECNLGEHVFVEGGARLGDRVVVKNQVQIWQGVTIEQDVFVGPGVMFTNDRYPRSRHMPEVRERYRRSSCWLVPTLIRRGASIGAGTVILPGVTIGAYAMVGAGAVVTDDVPEHALVVGNPARIVGTVCVCGVPLGGRNACPACELPAPEAACAGAR